MRAGAPGDVSRILGSASRSSLKSRLAWTDSTHRARRSDRGGISVPNGRGRTRGVSRNSVQRARETLMMSKAELARKAGLSALTIDRVESGRPCRLDTKRKILLALGKRVSDKDEIFDHEAGTAPTEPSTTAEPEGVHAR